MSRGRLEQEVKRRVWEGAISLRFTLDPTDSIALTSTSSLPKPYNCYYILAKRNEFLPFILKRLKEEWILPLLCLESPLATSRQLGDLSGESLETALGLVFEEFWIEYNGIPLKWHHPIGLLYDLKVLASPLPINKNLSDLDSQLASYVSSSKKIEEKTKPWDLILHLKKYPSDKLIKSPSIPLFKEMFMSLLKETDFVRNGSSRKVMDLSKSDQLSLLDGLENSSPSFFQNIDRLRGITEVDWAQNPNLQLPIHISKLPPNIPRAIPIRFYIIDASTATDDTHSIIQIPSSVYCLLEDISQKDQRISLSNFKWITLLDSIYSILSEHKLILPSTALDSDSIHEEPPDKLAKIQAELSTWKCIIHGIEPQLGTPLLWLADNFSYTDNFLHIILVDMKSFS
ncbi:hypothetical protein BB561_006692 [Smittium simulii]|uniref:Autophagy protein 5 n=1 Tax=Smittium simulii TaxID=133385 RepID=A0A2T9Y2D3_9FUNG|nr:hypothetical protein BB561_006692 [Smittium simulii]